MKRKKAWIIVGIAAMICAAGGIGFCLLSQKDNEPDAPVLPEGMTLSEGVVLAAGLTDVGMVKETCKLGFLEDGLYVEETYLNVGEEVEAHTPVFRVSEESLENARRELEKNVQETALNRRQGEVAYETGLVEAQKEKDLAAVEAQYAQAVYDNALKTAQEEVDARQQEVDSAQEKVDEYTASIEADYYYAYYKVGELEATWKDNAAFLMELYNSWNVAALEDIYGGSGGKNGIGYVTNQVSAASLPGGTAEMTQDGDSVGDSAGQSTGSGNDMPEMGNMGANVSDDEIRYNIYLAMAEETEESESAYETALENYEKAKAEAAAGMEAAKSELAMLQAKLKEQQNAYEEAAISAKLTYELAVSENETAQMVYEMTVKQLEEDYDSLIEKEETAAENLALFEETVGDGFFYTSADGTVMMTAIRAKSWITEDAVVMAYSNPGTVTVAASVEQEDIASIEIGAQAYAVISGYGSYTGKVISLNPVSASGGSSNVIYTVNVLLEGDVSNLEANLTAYVYFGLTDEEKEMMSGSRQKGGRAEGAGWTQEDGGEFAMPERRQGGEE